MFDITLRSLLTAIFAGLGIGSIYALVAVGFNLIRSTTNVFNFAQGDVVTVGAFVGFAALAERDLPVLIAVLLAILIAAAVGLAIEFVAVRPLGDPATTHSWLVTTLGAGILLQSILLIVYGPTARRVPSLIDDSPISVGDAVIRPAFLLAFLLAITLVVAIELVFRLTRRGKGWLAMAEDREAAQLRGVSPTAVRMFTFAAACAVSGLAGIVIAPVVFARFDAGALLTIKGFVAMAIGGFGSHRGALVGGWIVGLVETVSILFVSAIYGNLLVFAVLLIFLMVRPRGLFGDIQERVV
ncbi:MAG: branched-chain amino acid ABC transporter permease [Solirubrobacterales bacterium]